MSCPDPSTLSPNSIDEIGQHLLDRAPNVIVRHRLLRDVLPPDYNPPVFFKTKTNLLAHRWIVELAREQQSDGSWGRFHSMDSTQKKRFPTSEIAIRRALDLGMEKDDPVLKKAIRCMVDVLKGRRVWSDRAEKSEGWPIGVETITAGTLSQADPAHSAIRSAWEYWVEVAERSFASGGYDPRAEWQAHKDLRGRGIIYLRSRYALTLLGARSANLPPALDRCIVEWIWNDPEGIGYLGANMKHPRPFHIFNWLESLEILSCFRCWREFGAEAMQWLWEWRNADGL